MKGNSWRLKQSDQFHSWHTLYTRIVFTVLAFFLPFGSASSFPVKAAEPDPAGQPPHLIQTVTEQDLYEGLLALGFLECPALEEEDIEAAYENVRKCVVGIRMGNAYGSGIILQMTPEHIVIATNKHVLDYWEDDTGYVQFYQGYAADGHILDVSEQYDIGFLTIENEQLGFVALQSLYYARCSEDVYRKLEAQDEIFCVGGIREEEDYYPGTVEDIWVYIDELEGYMLQADGEAIPGMSGGGTFDAKGNLVGMVTAGSLNAETASIPLPVLLEAYEEMAGNTSE